MKRAVFALAALALFVAPSMASAQSAQTPIMPDFPDDVKALGPVWVADVEARIRPHADKSWFGDVEAFLEKARGEAAEGRVRAAMFDLETAVELLHANILVDETAGRSDAERKARVIERTQQFNAEAEDAWTAFRARMAGMDGDIASLHAMELALYAGDIALTAKINVNNHVQLVPEFRKVPFSKEATLDMLRASLTPMISLGFADDVLTAALEREGLPPRLDQEAWQTRYALPELRRTPDETGRLKAWEDVARDVRAANETTLSVVIALAEQRALRQQQIALSYGDAGSRGIDVLRDAAKFMERRLNRTSFDDVRPYGLLGVATSDAVDQARFILAFHKDGKAQLPFITATWANLDHQEFVALVLADVNAEKPEAETLLGFQNDLTKYNPDGWPKTQTEKKQQTPGLAPLAMLAGVAVAALAFHRRGGKRHS